MAVHLYPNFLNDAQEYTQAEAFWRDLWARVEWETGQQGKWRYPWLETTFANGAPFRDGDPIFSALSPLRDLAVRVIQHEPESDEIELDFWVESFGEGEAGGAVRVLVISCALSDQAALFARRLIYSWLLAGEVSVSRTNGAAST